MAVILSRLRCIDIRPVGNLIHPLVFVTTIILLFPNNIADYTAFLICVLELHN